MGGCPDTDINPGFVLQIERLTLAGPLNIFVPFLVFVPLRFYRAIYIYIYNPHSVYNGNRTEWGPTD